MNQKGNVMSAAMGGLMFAIGMLIFLTLWSPLFSYMEPLFNTETMAMSSLVRQLILIVPFVLTGVGLVIIANEAFGNRGEISYR